MMRKILILLAVGVAPLGLWASEELQFTTFLSHYPGRELPNFAVLEVINPEHQMEVNGTTQFCHNGNNGEIAIYGQHPAILGDVRLAGNSKALRSDTQGEYRISKSLAISVLKPTTSVVSFTGGQLLATQVEFQATAATLPAKIGVGETLYVPTTDISVKAARIDSLNINNGDSVIEYNSSLNGKSVQQWALDGGAYIPYAQ